MQTAFQAIARSFLIFYSRICKKQRMIQRPDFSLISVCLNRNLREFSVLRRLVTSMLSFTYKPLMLMLGAFQMSIFPYKCLKK